MQYTIALRPEPPSNVGQELTVNADEVTVESLDGTGNDYFTYYKFTDREDVTALLSVKDVLYIKRS